MSLRRGIRVSNYHARYRGGSRQMTLRNRPRPVCTSPRTLSLVSPSKDLSSHPTSHRYLHPYLYLSHLPTYPHPSSTIKSPPPHTTPHKRYQISDAASAAPPLASDTTTYPRPDQTRPDQTKRLHHPRPSHPIPSHPIPSIHVPHTCTPPSSYIPTAAP
ncbi:hypothetical protein P171DRAFT_255685 [Karstenula rhodostoma CBS 690.94]|uniref:Uncharacterized protein n=1 Tax=Karstenula rhodostoma CBS 690.94 TaxID=1392251 RepID=A0A9P4PNX8_9PLEO|nr:hypothetical protein P171DRAFT_255685 [Karstenula rhodostoma CBS 690.94]